MQPRPQDPTKHSPLEDKSKSVKLPPLHLQRTELDTTIRKAITHRGRKERSKDAIKRSGSTGSLDKEKVKKKR